LSTLNWANKGNDSELGDITFLGVTVTVLYLHI